MRMFKMIKTGLMSVVMFMFLSGAAFSQAIPSSKLLWDEAGVDLATVSAYTYKYYPDGSATGTALTGVTCSGTTTFSCQTNFPAFTPGAHTLQMTATNAAGESAKSVVFNFTFIVVPGVPSNIRIG